MTAFPHSEVRTLETSMENFLDAPRDLNADDRLQSTPLVSPDRGALLLQSIKLSLSEGAFWTSCVLNALIAAHCALPPAEFVSSRLTSSCTLSCCLMILDRSTQASASIDASELNAASNPKPPAVAAALSTTEQMLLRQVEWDDLAEDDFVVLLKPQCLLAAPPVLPPPPHWQRSQRERRDLRPD
jgi:hypothetical protein